MSVNRSTNIRLPKPIIAGGLPVNEAIHHRRSIRSFSSEPVQLFQLSQILWAAQGITYPPGNARTVPSAGATYPLEIYAVIGDNAINTVDSGVYHYEVADHTLSLHISGDIRPELASAALGQYFISVAPFSLVICSVDNRILSRYHARAERYVFMEVGHAGQNICLQATALSLGTVTVGAFRDEEVRRILCLDSKTRPLYITPVGRPL
jgi:SagB-type dehydrogenase family enzyme